MTVAPAAAAETAAADETFEFQAEVSRLLRLMVDSVYSNKDVFLRELVSNAADACDKLRYLALTEPHLVADGAPFRILVRLDRDAGTLTVIDNGIGMSRADLIEHLGTIARSGTAAFVEKLSGDRAKDIGLIGQFGVGFYAAFMVADQVTVLTRRAGEDKAWRWTSDGMGRYAIAEAPTDIAGPRGTHVVLKLKDDASAYLDRGQVEQVIRTYSDHIGLPVMIEEAGAAAASPESSQINRASALWARPKAEITEAQYRDFYKAQFRAHDEPWSILHAQAEGLIEYSLLLFIPGEKPFDLYDPQRQHRVKLYVRKIFITESCGGLVPAYLRFLRGVVDAADLPLNLSREMLQHNPLVAKIRTALTKRVLAELEKKAKDEPDSYAKFWGLYGPVLKEGVYEDAERRELLLKLCRFRSTAAEGETVSIEDYVRRMKPDQTAIYYNVGEDIDSVRRSPQLEGFKARGVEVLLLADPVDHFWLNAVSEFQGKKLKSVTQGGADLDKLAVEAKSGEAAKPEPAAEGDLAVLIALARQALGELVLDVRASQRLTESPVCLVADDGAFDMHFERVMKRYRQLDLAAPRVLEINPGHDLIKRLAAAAKAGGRAAELAESVRLLLDQARILEGEPLPDPTAFSRRLAEAMARGF